MEGMILILGIDEGWFENNGEKLKEGVPEGDNFDGWGLRAKILSVGKALSDVEKKNPMVEYLLLEVVMVGVPL